MNSLSIKHEQKAFDDFVLKGRNLIFMNLNFNQSNFDAFVEERKLERWVWVANDYRYILSYPEDVDVFSFGLLKGKQDSVEVKINIGNLTEACKRHFNSYLAQHISKIVQRNSSITDNVFNTSEGYICHSKLEIGWLKRKVSDFSAVQLGYPFWCYTDNNTTTVVEKSYVNYILIFIIFFTYCFYPLAVESAFYIEDKKTVQGYYYMSESPYSPSVLCKRILFAGNNKYLATLRIILFVIVLTSVIYGIKEYVYDNCHCSLRSSNDDESFKHAENIYVNYPGYFCWGVFHFIVVNICVLFNANGDLDDFIILDFTKTCCCFNCGMCLKTVQVSAFFSNDENQSNLEEKQNYQKRQIVSNKIRKIFLLFSLSFWSKLFFINSFSQNCQNTNCQCKEGVYLQSVICFPINIVLVISSTFCPLVSMVYIFFVNHFFAAIGKLVYENQTCCKANRGDNKRDEDNTVAKFTEGNEIIEMEEIILKQDEEDTAAKRNEQNDNKRDEDETEVKCTEGNESIKTEETILKQNNEQNENNDNKKMGEREINGVTRNEEITKKKICRCTSELVSHVIIIAYLISTYMLSFNIFFYGISYVVQFFIFTLFVAVPHFPIQSYIYVIFFTSVVIYISRFVFQFIKLYKSLLEKILEIQGQNSIAIKHFNKVVAKHFPLFNELFYLLLKIMLSALFFAIIYDTMQNVGYIRFGAQPDLTTIISLIFLFGPPRLVETLLTTDFTSRVHMKEKEIKDELEQIKTESTTKEPRTIKTMSITLPVLTTEEEGICCNPILKKFCAYVRHGKNDSYSPGILCEKWDEKSNTSYSENSQNSDKKKVLNSENSKKPCCYYRPKCFCLRWIGMLLCGFCNCPFDDEGNCKCCVILTTNSRFKKTTNSSEAPTKFYDVQTSYLKIPCACVKDCLNEDNTKSTEEEINLVNELKTDTLYKITVDTVDETRPRTTYKVKAEIINDGMIERENTNFSDEEIVNKGLERKTNTTTKIKRMKSKNNEHDEETNDDNAENVRASVTIDEKRQPYVTRIHVPSTIKPNLNRQEGNGD